MRNVVLSGRPLVPPNAKGCELPTTRGPRLISPRSYSLPACASSGCPCNKCLPRTCSLALSYPRVVATKRSRRRMRWMSTLLSCCCCCGCRTGGPACGRQFPPQSPSLWMGDVISPAHSSSLTCSNSSFLLCLSAKLSTCGPHQALATAGSSICGSGSATASSHSTGTAGRWIN